MKILIIFTVLNLSFAENIFTQKLDNLLNFCLHQHELDSGTLLGVAFAKGQLMSISEIDKVEILIEKCDVLRDQFVIDGGHFFHSSNEIGKKIDYHEKILINFHSRSKGNLRFLLIRASLRGEIWESSAKCKKNRFARAIC